jgi:hypothetical protein
MGVVIEICAKYPGGPTRITVADIKHGVSGRITALHRVL